MTLGLTFEKLLLIGFLAAMLIGPARLPVYAAGLRRFVDRAKGLLHTAEGRVRDELGPEFTDTDWRQLDPRRFDPRRIVREALLAEPDPVPRPAAARASEPGGTSAMTTSAEPESGRGDASA